MTPLGEAREYVKTALAGLDVNVYDIAPQAGLTPPAVVIKPSQNWLEPHTLKQTKVNLDLEVTAQPAGTNLAAQERLEDLIWSILQIFPMASSVGSPIGEKVGQADLLTAIVPISVQVND